MDRENPHPTPNDAEPKRPLTAEEIARAEAEAVAAMLRGEAPQRPKAPAADETPAPEKAETPAQPGFVPYVDDVVEPEAKAEGGDADADDEPYIPGPMEKRIDALSEKQWKLYQGIGGALVGLAAIGILLAFNGDLSMYGLAVAALVTLALPRYLERAWNHKMPFARIIMLVAMVVGLALTIVLTGLNHGFTIVDKGP